jgi:hypothetical protein
MATLLCFLHTHPCLTFATTGCDLNHEILPGDSGSLLINDYLGVLGVLRGAKLEAPFTDGFCILSITKESNE